LTLINQYINGIDIQELLGAFKYCLAARMQDTLPFAGVIQKFGTIPAAWGCVERIATLKALCCPKKVTSELLAIFPAIYYSIQNIYNLAVRRYLIQLN